MNAMPAVLYNKLELVMTCGTITLPKYLSTLMRITRSDEQLR